MTARTCLVCWVEHRKRPRKGTMTWEIKGRFIPSKETIGGITTVGIKFGYHQVIDGEFPICRTHYLSTHKEIDQLENQLENEF